MSKNISGKILDHLGLVAATIGELGLEAEVDRRLPISKEKGAKLSMGQRVSGMILNGLGFVDTRLYMYAEYLEKIAVDRLIGKDVRAEDFTDDALGRCLDAISNYGTERLFSEIAFRIGTEQGLLGKTVHLDTTSLSVYGDYDDEHTDGPAYGYSKDHRSDLKQMVLNLATTGAAGFPVWMEAHAGNASDKVILHEAAKKMVAFTQQLEESPEFSYVADSAMYERCVNQATQFKWISRVPEKSKEALALLEKNEKELSWKDLGDGYTIVSQEMIYKGIKQRWCLVSSEQAMKRESKTLDKAVAKAQEKATKAFWHLTCQTFACEKDAQKAIATLEKKLPYHRLETAIQKQTQHSRKGRPKAGASPQVVGYVVTGSVLTDDETIERIRRRKGRFILATNQCDATILPDEDLLHTYKDQSKTESGFRFIKDNTFEVSGIFLKKTSRISALMMIMTVCLMVYSVAQYRLRQSLISAQETVPDQRKKPTQNPSLTRVFKFFFGVQVLHIPLANGPPQKCVINLTDISQRIVHLFGDSARKIYGLTTS